MLAVNSLDNRPVPGFKKFSYFYLKQYVVGTHLKHPMEMLPMTTLNNFFHNKIRKILKFLVMKNVLSWAMIVNVF